MRVLVLFASMKGWGLKLLSAPCMDSCTMVRFDCFVCGSGWVGGGRLGRAVSWCVSDVWDSCALEENGGGFAVECNALS